MLQLFVLRIVFIRDVFSKLYGIKMIRIFQFLILIFSFSSCIIELDKENKVCDSYKFSDEYKSYVMYNEGSYWIYKDSLYNKVDSVVLLEQFLYLEDNCEAKSRYEEKLYQKIYSSYFSVHKDFYEVYSSSYDSRYYTLGTAYPMGHFWVSDSLLDSLKISDKWYYDVMVVELPSTTKYYWAKNIGLIRKSLRYPYNNDTTILFDLVDYKLQ